MIDLYVSTIILFLRAYYKKSNLIIIMIFYIQIVKHNYILQKD